MKKEEAEDIMRENVGENIVKNTRKEENVEAAKVSYGEMRGKQWALFLGYRIWNIIARVWIHTLQLLRIMTGEQDYEPQFLCKMVW